MNTSNNTLIQITQNGMGRGSDELGLKLIANYFKLLIADNNLPKIIVFYNAGVKLICKDSPIVLPLKEMEKLGVKLIACKTCLEFFKIDNLVEVGKVGSMVDIITLQTAANKVINL